MKTFSSIVTASLLSLTLLGCGEEPTVQRYETTQPVGFDWPATERRDDVVTVDNLSWTWEVPAGWIDAPEVPEQLVADYRFPGSTDDLPGRLTVSHIDGDAGGTDANVMRWLQQLYVTTARRLGPNDRVSQPMSIPVGTATFVELHGQYQGPYLPTRISAAIVQIPAEGGGVFQTWFFKLAGDDATIEANRMALAKMILSFRPEGTEMPSLPGLDPTAPAPPPTPTTPPAKPAEPADTEADESTEEVTDES
jgi:hypothetical protein